MYSSGGLLAQDEVDDTRDKGKGKGNPGKDEGCSMLARFLIFMENIRVDRSEERRVGKEC